MCDLNNGDSADGSILPHVDLNLYDTPCVQSCGQATIRCYLENDYPAPINLPACIRAQPGVAASNFRRIGDFTGRIMRVPLYDRGVRLAGRSAGCRRLRRPVVLSHRRFRVHPDRRRRSGSAESTARPRHGQQRQMAEGAGEL